MNYFSLKDIFYNLLVFLPTISFKVCMSISLQCEIVSNFTYLKVLFYLYFGRCVLQPSSIVVLLAGLTIN